RELGIDEVAGRDGGVAAALVIELEQAAAAAQRFARVAAHARHPLCRLDAPDEALRGPGRVLERLQLREQLPRGRQVARLRRGAGRARQRVAEQEAVRLLRIEPACERQRLL